MVLETLRVIDNIYQATVADTVRQGSLVNFPNPFPRQVVAAVALAMEHLNSGNGSIIPEIQDLNQTCNIRFVPEFIDTQGDAKVAVKQLIRVLDRDQFQPCAFIGGFFSGVSIPTAIITGAFGYLQMNALSSDPELDNKEKFPLFASVRTKADGFWRPLMEYIYKEWGIRHIAVLHENSDVSLAYLDRLLRIQGDFPDMKLVSVGFPENEVSTPSFESNIKLLKETELRFFVVISSGLLIPRILQVASSQGIAGTGRHNWIFWDTSAALLPPNEFRSNSSLLRAASGTFIYTSEQSRQGVGFYSKFVSAWSAIRESTDDTTFLQSKLPRHIDASEYSTHFGADVFAELFPFVPLFYDTTVMLGLSACATQVGTLDGQRHFAALFNTSFVGASGSLELNPQTGARASSSGIFLLRNYVPKQLDNGNYTFDVRELALYEGGSWQNVSSLLPVFNDQTSNIPSDLPPLSVEENHIGPALRFFGFGLFVVVILTAVVMASWTFLHSKSPVIRASQPMFLYFICIGATIMAASLIPMSLDDEVLTDPSIACFGYPVLLTVGWNVTISALLSKTMVVNLVFHKPAFQRVVLKRSDILKPMVTLLLANVLLLVLWAVLSPYKWNRSTVEEDQFKRSTETLGACESEHGRVFWPIFLVTNVGVLLFAIQQAFVARKIAVEFAETEFISMAMGIALFFLFVACPVMYMVEDDPRVFYFVRCAFVFAISMTVLLFLFVPKIFSFHHGNRDLGAAVRSTLERLRKSDLRSVPEDNGIECEQMGSRVVDHPKLRQAKEETLAKLYARNKFLEERLAEFESDHGAVSVSDAMSLKSQQSSTHFGSIEDYSEDVRIAVEVGASYLQDAMKRNSSRRAKILDDRLHKPDNQMTPSENQIESEPMGSLVVDHPKLRQGREETLAKLYARNKFLEGRLAECESVSDGEDHVSVTMNSLEDSASASDMLSLLIGQRSSANFRSIVDSSEEDVRIGVGVGASYLQEAMAHKTRLANAGDNEIRQSGRSLQH